MNRVSFFTVLFLLLFLTYVVVASLIAFFTVKIVGIPIGKKMFTKIVLSILAFVPLYLLVAYAISRFVSKDLLRLEESVRKLPFSGKAPGSWIREIDRLSEVISLQSERIGGMVEAQRFMLYRIAHDLRTPLTNLRNVLLALREGLIGEEERDSYLEKLLRETEKMEALLESALSNLKKVSRDTERKDVELCSLLEEVRSLWELRLAQKNVKLVVDCPPNLSVRISPVDLEEILNNLIDNILKHTDSKLIEVGVRASDRWAEIKVGDRGKGFNSANLRDAYRKGSLGLYIVRELTWKNGGEFFINSSDTGTEVVLRFPLG